MEKYQRIDTPNHARFLTFGTYRHKHMFRDDYLCQLFLNILHEQSQIAPFEIWAYVIMANHIHLILFANEGISIRSQIAIVKRKFSKQAIHYLVDIKSKHLNDFRIVEKGKSRTRIFQQGGGYDRDLWTPAEILKTIRYIHSNPTRSGLVQDELAYKWSSAKYWEDMNLAGNIMNVESYPF